MLIGSIEFGKYKTADKCDRAVRLGLRRTPGSTTPRIHKSDFGTGPTGAQSGLCSRRRHTSAFLLVIHLGISLQKI